jgi:dihydroflavonol-4-reductase
MAREREKARFDCGKAERELGLGFRPLEETLRDAAAWYRREGWLGQDGARGAAADARRAPATSPSSPR